MNNKAAYEQLLGRELPDPMGDNPNVSIKCFCHTDSHESCSVNLTNGGWFCHASGNKGYLPQAVMKIRGVDFREAKEILKKLGVSDEPIATTREVKEQPPIDDRLRDAYVRTLNNNAVKKEYAQKKLGWNPATLLKYHIGFSKETNRYTIPISDETGAVRNIRMYDPDSKGPNKMISWKQGYGSPARLFPMESFSATTLILCEGEKDCLLMNQEIALFGPDDWAAVTGTGGAGTWRDAWNEKFESKHVIIIYDRDEAGITNAQSIASRLVKHAISVKVVTLDITEPAGADITNYFQDSGKGWDDLAILINNTEPFTPETLRQHVARPVDETIYEPHLSEASQDRYAHKNIKLKVMVAGKELAPFIVPKDVAYNCKQNFGVNCETCSLSRHNGLLEKSFEPTDPVLVEMLRLSKQELAGFMRRKLGINGKCPMVRTHIETEQNVEEVTLVPELDFSDSDRSQREAATRRVGTRFGGHPPGRRNADLEGFRWRRNTSLWLWSGRCLQSSVRRKGSRGCPLGFRRRDRHPRANEVRR